MTSLEFMQGPGTSPFPPTGIYYRLAHKCLVPRFFTAFRMTESRGHPMTSAASISSRRTLVIRGRSADNRKAPLNFSFPLEGKCHVVAKGCTRVSIPMKLAIVLLGRASADLETLCRVSTKRRILARKASDRNAINYQSAEPRRQALPSHQPLAH